MPWTPKQHRFFELCYHSPGKAKGKCPPKATAAKMAHEGIKKSKRKKPMLRTNHYY